MRRLFLTFCAVLALPVLGAAAPFEHVLTGCGTITKSGIYRLDRDLLGNVDSACLRIQNVTDVKLDCQGHSIRTDSSSLAALVIESVKNFTIQACDFPQLSGYSLFIGNSSAGTVTRNTLKDMIVNAPQPEQAESLRLLENRFTEFDPAKTESLDFGGDRIGVIPLEPGWTRIEAKALAVPSLPGMHVPDVVSMTPPDVHPRIFPNPWRADRHASVLVSFEQLPDNTTIHLFTVSAHLIRTLQAPHGEAAWDLTNAAGQPVASGLYLYLLSDPSGWKKSGKLSLIR